MIARGRVLLIVCILCLTGAALVLLTPPSRIRNVAGRADVGGAKPSPAPQAAIDLDPFPLEHAPSCDFSAYKRVMISDWLHGAILSQVEPKYPDGARAKRISGRVDVTILINRQGRVERTCSTGPAELLAAAETAAAQWRFHRPTVNGATDPLPYIEEGLVFNFVLDDNAPRR